MRISAERAAGLRGPVWLAGIGDVALDPPALVERASWTGSELGVETVLTIHLGDGAMADVTVYGAVPVRVLSEAEMRA